MLQRTLKRLGRTVAGWFRRPGQEPKGRLFKGSHSAFGRTISLVQLTSGRRPYLLYLPRDYQKQTCLPMVVMMHGCKQDAQTFANATRMNGLADRDGFIVLYPEQRKLANMNRCWNWFSRSSQEGGGEAGIVADMVRSIAREYNADSGRIYVAGLSAGGAMAANLAISHANLFSACAIHSGLMYRAATSTGQALSAMRNGSRSSPVKASEEAFRIARGASSSIPVVVIHGTEDDVVSPVNAEQVVSQFKLVNELLAKRDVGRGSPLDVGNKNSRSPNGYGYTTESYSNRDHLLIQKVMISGLGHAWSGGSGDFPYNDPSGPDASEIICDFFAEHGLR